MRVFSGGDSGAQTQGLAPRRHVSCLLCPELHRAVGHWGLSSAAPERLQIRVLKFPFFLALAGLLPCRVT